MPNASSGEYVAKKSTRPQRPETSADAARAGHIFMRQTAFGTISLAQLAPLLTSIFESAVKIADNIWDNPNSGKPSSKRQVSLPRAILDRIEVYTNNDRWRRRARGDARTVAPALRFS